MFQRHPAERPRPAGHLDECGGDGIRPVGHGFTPLFYHRRLIFQDEQASCPGIGRHVPARCGEMPFPGARTVSTAYSGLFSGRTGLVQGLQNSGMVRETFQRLFAHIRAFPEFPGFQVGAGQNPFRGYGTTGGRSREEKRWLRMASDIHTLAESGNMRERISEEYRLPVWRQRAQ